MPSTHSKPCGSQRNCEGQVGRCLGLIMKALCGHCSSFGSSLARSRHTCRVESHSNGTHIMEHVRTWTVRPFVGLDSDFSHRHAAVPLALPGLRNREHGPKSSLAKSRIPIPELQMITKPNWSVDKGS